MSNVVKGNKNLLFPETYLRLQLYNRNHLRYELIFRRRKYTRQVASSTTDVYYRHLSTMNPERDRSYAYNT